MDDLSPSKISKDEVHKIALLDIRLMNADRNAANLLCRIRPEDGSIELVPIDHGFCLRDVCDVSWMDWCWLDWPQMKEVSFWDARFRHVFRSHNSTYHFSFLAYLAGDQGIHQ